MIFRPELVAKILDGSKTQTRRLVYADAPCRYRPGRTYAVQPGHGQHAVARIHILTVDREELGDITSPDAVAEGFESIAEFFDYWWTLYDRDSYPGRMHALVDRIRFRLVPPRGGLEEHPK